MLMITPLMIWSARIGYGYPGVERGRGSCPKKRRDEPDQQWRRDAEDRRS